MSRTFHRRPPKQHWTLQSDQAPAHGPQELTVVDLRASSEASARIKATHHARLTLGLDIDPKDWVIK